MSRARNLAGFATAIYPVDNLSVGFITCRDINITGVATFQNINVRAVEYADVAGIATVAEGLTGTPDITVGNITAGDASFSGDVSIAGTVSYQNVTDVNAVGLITAQQGIDVTGGNIDVTSGDVNISGNLNVSGVSTLGIFNGQVGEVTGVSTTLVSAIGIQSGGVTIGAGITQLNFVGTGNTFKVNGTTVDISIEGGGGTGGGSTAGTISTSFVFSNPNSISTDIQLTEPGRNYGMFGPISITANVVVGAGNSFTII